MDGIDGINPTLSGCLNQSYPVPQRLYSNLLAFQMQYPDNYNLFRPYSGSSYLALCTRNPGDYWAPHYLGPSLIRPRSHSWHFLGMFAYLQLSQSASQLLDFLFEHIGIWFH